MSRTGRNATLDLLKLIAAYMVVFIHVPFYGFFGTVISALARFAVPVFFVTAGYFCYENNTDKIKNKLKKIVYILIFASLLYNAMNVAMDYLNGGIPKVMEGLSVYGELSRWIDLLLFNLPFSATRLWFLLALIYVYVIQLILVKRKVNYKAILVLSLCTLILNLVLGELLAVFGVELPLHYVRNFLLTGYPFFGFGLLMRHRKEDMLNFSDAWTLALLVGGTILSLASAWYAPYVTLCLGAVIVTFAAFVICLKKGEVEYRSWQARVFECSLGIYILHKPVTVVCAKALSLLGLAENPALYHTVQPILVCIITTLATLVLNALRNKWSSMRKKMKQ